MGMYSYDRQVQRNLVEMIGDQNGNEVENEIHDVPAIPRIPPMIALSAKILNERIIFKRNKNSYEIKKPEYTITTIKSDNRLAPGTENTNSDTENTPEENPHVSEEMPPRSKSPNFDMCENNSPSRSESPGNMLECDFCTRTFAKRKKLLRHKKRKHVNPRKFSCKYCDHVCASKPAWDYHVKAKHQERQFVCEDCDKKFVTKYHLQSHIKSHKYQCHFCQKMFTTKNKLNRHKEIHRTLECGHCPRAFFREHRLQRHRIMKHPEIQQMREESNQPEPVCHEESNSPEPVCREESNQPEPVCRKESNESEESIHQDEPMCQDEELSSSCSEEESGNEEELPPTPTPQKCKHCCRTFPSLEALHHHWRVTGDNLIICVHCFEIFDDELAFSHHLLKHSEEKIFMCTLCSKTFVTMDLLENHFPTHSSMSNLTE